MKKLLLLGALISSVAMADVAEVRIGANLTNSGDLKGGRYDNNYVKHTLEKDVLKNGFEIAGEYRREFDAWELGGGLAFRYNKLNSKVPALSGYATTGQNKGLNSVPLYLTAKYNFKNSSEVTPYVKANLGYSFNSGSVSFTSTGTAGDVLTGEAKFKGGLFSGIGAGISFRNFTFDLAYNVNAARVSRTYTYKGAGTSYLSNDKFRLNHGTLTLGVGYTFGLQ